MHARLYSSGEDCGRAGGGGGGVRDDGQAVVGRRTKIKRTRNGQESRATGKTGFASPAAVMTPCGASSGGKNGDEHYHMPNTKDSTQHEDVAAAAQTATT